MRRVLITRAAVASLPDTVRTVIGVAPPNETTGLELIWPWDF